MLMIPALDDGINIETKRETIQIKTNENLMKKYKKKASCNRNKRDKKSL
jgi:hypothetical protein